MVAWVWVAVAALAVIALQAFLFHRARRNWGVDGDTGGFDAVESVSTNDPDAPEHPDGGVRCPHCGAHNEGAFTFCQQCLDRLR